MKPSKPFMVPEPDAFSDVQLLNVVAGRVMVRGVKDHTVLFVPALQTGVRGWSTWSCAR